MCHNAGEQRFERLAPLPQEGILELQSVSKALCIVQDIPRPRP